MQHDYVPFSGVFKTVAFTLGEGVCDIFTIFERFMLIVLDATINVDPVCIPNNIRFSVVINSKEQYYNIWPMYFEQ